MKHGADVYIFQIEANKIFRSINVDNDVISGNEMKNLLLCLPLFRKMLKLLKHC